MSDQQQSPSVRKIENLLSASMAAYDAFSLLDNTMMDLSLGDIDFDRARTANAEKLTGTAQMYAACARDFVTVFSDERLRKSILAYFYHEENASADRIAEVEASQIQALKQSQRDLSEANQLIEAAQLSGWPASSPEAWRTPLDLPSHTLERCDPALQLSVREQNQLIRTTLSSLDNNEGNDTDQNTARSAYVDEIRRAILRLRWRVLSSPIHAARLRGERFIKSGKVRVLSLPMLNDALLSQTLNN